MILNRTAGWGGRNLEGHVTESANQPGFDVDFLES